MSLLISNQSLPMRTSNLQPQQVGLEVDRLCLVGPLQLLKVALGLDVGEVPQQMLMGILIMFSLLLVKKMLWQGGVLCVTKMTLAMKQTTLSLSSQPGPKRCPPHDAKSIDYFYMFFTATLLQTFVTRTTLYAAQYLRVADSVAEMILSNGSPLHCLK